MSKVVNTPGKDVEEKEQSVTPQSKKNDKKSKPKDNKSAGEQKTLEGGAFIKHVLKKGGKNGTPLLIAELTEDVLQERLKLLQNELEEYKKRCAR